MRVYLAGKMRGLPEFGFPTFHDAAGVLRAEGHEVWSPAEHDLSEGFDPAKDEPKRLAHYMAVDLAIVCRSDAVVVLPGWEDSQGATLEVHVARECEIPVLAYPDLAPVRVEKPVFEDETILEEAARLVDGPRQTAYGHPRDDFTRTGRMWAPILGLDEVTPAQVSLCMVALKISRECNAHKRDNLVDGAGYWRTLEKVLEG